MILFFSKHLQVFLCKYLQVFLFKYFLVVPFSQSRKTSGPRCTEADTWCQGLLFSTPGALCCVLCCAVLCCVMLCCAVCCVVLNPWCSVLFALLCCELCTVCCAVCCVVVNPWCSELLSGSFHAINFPNALSNEIFSKRTFISVLCLFYQGNRKITSE